MFKYLFAWPDQLPDLSSLDNPISKIAVHIRRHELHDAQKLITVSTAITSQSSLSDLDANPFCISFQYFSFFYIRFKVTLMHKDLSIVAFNLMTYSMLILMSQPIFAFVSLSTKNPSNFLL